MWTSHRIELEKSDVQLMCRAEGDPRPAVMWLDRDFVTIKNDSKQYEVRAAHLRPVYSDATRLNSTSS